MDEDSVSVYTQRLALSGIRPVSASYETCVTCRVVIADVFWPNIQALPDRASDDDLSSQIYVARLGWLDRLVATKACPLCQFIARVFSRSTKPEEQVDITRAKRVSCELEMWGGLRWQVTGICLDWDIRINFRAYRYNALLGKHDGDQQSLVQNLYLRVLKLLLDSCLDVVHPQNGFCEGDKVYHLARRVDEECGRAFIRNTYKRCLLSHGDACNAPKNVFRAPPSDTSASASAPYSRLLVDVAERRIIDAPAGSRFVALSYCWAKKPNVRLLLSNNVFLRTKNAIDLAHLAPTVADAMDVTTSLGERYLSVDSLCVVQDSLESKTQEIQAMGSMYRNAVLTIIAAPQSSADEDQGLLGMRPGIRPVQQDVVKIRECTFAATIPDLSTALRWSRWSSRAWTYQEHLMSKSELIFTPYQAFFSCQQDAWSEDLVDNACVHLTDDDADERPCCVYQTPARCEGNRVEGVPRLVEPDNEVPSYEALIEEYTARRLSYQYDVLNGINGLLSLLSLETGVLLLCGLPIPRLLDHYLFWMPRGSTRRRKLFEVPGETFPSWSWTGWEGAVYFPRTLPVGYEQWDEKAYGNRSIVGGAGDYDVYQATGLLWSDVVVFEDLVPTSHRLPFPSPAGEGKTRGKKQVSGQKCQNTWLRFVAFVAAVSVSRQAWGTFMLAVDGSRASACHALFVEGSRAGLVVFHQSDPLPQYDTNTKAKEDAWTASPNTTERCEILALSTDNEPWGLHLPISDDPDDLANSGVLGPQEERMVRYHLPFDECKWPEDGQEIPMVNVIVVERCERMMYRRGVDQMHPEAWWKSAYKEEAVWLG